jgi:hypothetical protein
MSVPGTAKPPKFAFMQVNYFPSAYEWNRGGGASPGAAAVAETRPIASRESR